MFQSGGIGSVCKSLDLRARPIVLSQVEFFIDAGSHGSKPVHGGRIAQDRGTTEATEIREQKEEGGEGGEEEGEEEEDDDKVSGRGREE